MIPRLRRRNFSDCSRLCPREKSQWEKHLEASESRGALKAGVILVVITVAEAHFLMNLFAEPGLVLSAVNGEMS